MAMIETPVLLKPPIVSEALQGMIDSFFRSSPSPIIIEKVSQLPYLEKRLVVVAAELDKAGNCLAVSEMLSALSEKGPNCLLDARAMLLIRSNSELYTKSYAAHVVFVLNTLGASFPGHPVIEATASFANFKTWQKTMAVSLEEICMKLCTSAGERFFRQERSKKSSRSILVLHASSDKTSNTLALWRMVKSRLHNCTINELHVQNGTILDCKGCSFKTCSYYSSHTSCFYGGSIVKEIFPAILKADVVIWVCPNYNDSVSANLMAVINRMTALYRKTSFYNKQLYAVIVSGNSGSDSVAKQLLDALCINKDFALPPNFCLMATANDPGAIYQVEGIEKRAEQFAERIMKTLDKRL